MLFDKIKALCEKKGVSVWKLEKDLGFSNRSVSKWNESEPGIRKVQKVADYLGVAIEDLLEQGVRGTELKTVSIDSKERIFLDGEEIQNVTAYKLENFSDSQEPAKLTVTMYVNVGRV